MTHSKQTNLSIIAKGDCDSVSPTGSPLVSIVIPCYNRTELLKETLSCISSQSHHPLEILIVDDASEEDLLPAITSSLLSFKGIWKCIRLTQNQGPGISRKIGHEFSTGTFIQFLDSDDILATSKIEQQVKFLTEFPELIMTYCLTHNLERNKSNTLLGRTNEEFTRILPESLFRITWQTSSCLWRASKISPKNWKRLYGPEDILFDFLTGLQDYPIAKTPGNTPLLFKRIEDTGISFGIAGNLKYQKEILKSYDYFLQALTTPPHNRSIHFDSWLRIIIKKYQQKIFPFLTFRDEDSVIHCFKIIKQYFPSFLSPTEKLCFYLYGGLFSTLPLTMLRKWYWLKKLACKII
ncbi:MAG: glycosyltransferase family 2 protein [Fibrobacteria bacterium]|nr:glycosyltransferase family 2 protein [Fibrobacteria bacterium]